MGFTSKDTLVVYYENGYVHNNISHFPENLYYYYKCKIFSISDCLSRMKAIERVVTRLERGMTEITLTPLNSSRVSGNRRWALVGDLGIPLITIPLTSRS
jgi:predicted ATPase